MDSSAALVSASAASLEGFGCVCVFFSSLTRGNSLALG